MVKMNRYSDGSPDSIWRSFCKSRADYTCEICKKRQSPRSLHAHHLASYSDNPDLRTDVNNCAVLCKNCHNAFHDEYGRGGNTKSQFEKFILEYKPKIKKEKILTIKPFKKLKIRKFKVK